jgi:hypothetical protein
MPDIDVNLTPDAFKAAVQDALNLLAAYPSQGDDTAYKQQLGDVLKPLLAASQHGLNEAATAVGNELHGFVTVMRATLSLLVQEMDVPELELMRAIEKVVEGLVDAQEAHDDSD